MKIATYFLNIIKGKEIYQFALVGVGAAISVLTLTWLFTSVFEIFYAYSVALAFELTFVWGFFVHDKWTFKNIVKKHSLVHRFLRYNLIGIIGLGVNEAILLFLTMMLGLHYLLAEFFAIVFTFSFNYIINKKFAWNSK